MRAPRHPALRVAQLVLGALLVVLAPLAIPLPGPAGLLLFTGGAVLILRNSARARRRFAKVARGWPRIAGLVYRAMRRGSTLRRLARDRAARLPPR